MQYNCTFTSYRRGAAAVGFDYSGSATLTDESGYIEPLSGELRGVFGIDFAVKAFELLTEAVDLQVSDKVVIASEDYYAESVSIIEVNSTKLARCIIRIQEL